MARFGGPKDPRSLKSDARRQRHLRAIGPGDDFVWLPTTQAAERLGVNKSQLTRWRKAAKIEGRKVGARWEYKVRVDAPQKMAPAKETAAAVAIQAIKQGQLPELVADKARAMSHADVKQLSFWVALELHSGRMEPVVAKVWEGLIKTIQRSVEQDQVSAAMPDVIAVPHRPAALDPDQIVDESDEIPVGG